MIFDRIEHLEAYRCLGDNFAKAVTFIQGLDREAMGEQEYVIDGQNVYAFAKHFPLKTTKEVQFESHLRYVDIQLLLHGQESVYVCDTEGLQEAVAYDAAKDIAFYDDGSQNTLLKLLPGNFGLFFPWDAHKPCCHLGDCSSSHKLVVKVLL